MKKANFAIISICIIFASGCANKMSATVSPQFAVKITPVSQIGVSGGGASPGSAAFVKAGYRVKDLGNDSTAAIAIAKRNNIPFVAIIDPVGTEGSWWDGFFDFSMRVNETKSGTIVWSATAEYGQAGLFINQTKSTKEAMRDMVKDFSKYFPPKFEAGGDELLVESDDLQVEPDKLTGPFGSMPVVNYSYNATSQKGMLSVDISGKGIEARDWIIKNIGKICSSKNITMEAGKETKTGGYYRVLNESVQDGILTIEFEAVR